MVTNHLTNCKFEVVGTLDFFLGLALSDSEIRSAMLPYVKTMKMPSRIYARLIDYLKDPEFSLKRLVDVADKDVIKLALTLSSKNDTPNSKKTTRT